MLLGTLDGYKLVKNVYFSTATLEEDPTPDGWETETVTVHPEGASRCGIYVIDNGEVLRLEEAVGTILALEDVYGVLNITEHCYLDMALSFPFLEGETITGVK